MSEPAAAPVVPRPAASVVIVRSSAPGAPEPLEVWMIRRHQTMKFLGGYYAFPGGRVDASDGTAYATLADAGITRLYTLSLATGGATLIGVIDVDSEVQGIAIAP